jgi:hypothetical protein
MSIQAYDADMVEAPGAETLAAGAFANLWSAFGSVWPLWSVLTLVNAIAAAAGEGAGGLGQLPGLIGSVVAAALVSGVAIRLLLGRGLAAWKPDPGLVVYSGVVALLGAGPAVLALVAQPPVQNASQAALSSYTTTAALAAVAGLAIFWVGARLSLWPIGRLLGTAEMTPGRSWRLMRGVVLRYAMATILLAAPVIILDIMVSMLTKAQGHLIGQIAATPLTSLVTLLAAAVAAEVYRSRAIIPDPSVIVA